eukprot:1799919-Rhodomonas_salina.2
MRSRTEGNDRGEEERQGDNRKGNGTRGGMLSPRVGCILACVRVCVHIKCGGAAGCGTPGEEKGR